jgi:RNA polymerase sigma-70 factor (ECF subfamily)
MGPSPPESGPAASDGQLMAAIARGDEQAFAALYDQFAPCLHAVCLRILGRAGDAEAVLSDVFWELWRHAERFDPERGSLTAYVTLLARSRAIDRLRSEASRTAAQTRLRTRQLEQVAQQPGQGDPTGAAVAEEDSQWVRSALEGLSETQRRTLELAYFEGLTHREIAEKLQRPLGSVKTDIRRGLFRLRAAMRSRSAGREAS